MGWSLLDPWKDHRDGHQIFFIPFLAPSTFNFAFSFTYSLYPPTGTLNQSLGLFSSNFTKFPRTTLMHNPFEFSNFAQNMRPFLKFYNIKKFVPFHFLAPSQIEAKTNQKLRGFWFLTSLCRNFKCLFNFFLLLIFLEECLIFGDCSLHAEDSWLESFVSLSLSSYSTRGDDFSMGRLMLSVLDLLGAIEIRVCVERERRWEVL